MSYDTPGAHTSDVQLSFVSVILQSEELLKVGGIVFFFFFLGPLYPVTGATFVSI